MTARELRDAAVALLLAGEHDEALVYLRQGLELSPDDWELLHGMAVAVQATQGVDAARPYYGRALEVRPDDVRTLTTFGLGLHRSGQNEEAKQLFWRAATTEPNYEDAYLGLALAQTELEELEKALYNLDAAGKAIARKAALHAGLHNSPTSRVYPFRSIGRDLWHEQAVFGALYLAATEDGIGAIAWPTDEMAKAEYKDRQYGGLYFLDTRTSETTTRRFLPNYFDSFREWLVGHMSYVTICLQTSQVMHLLGRQEEALAYRSEADGFTNASAPQLGM